MKALLTYILATLVVGFSICPAPAEFSLGINRTNGNLIAADLWRDHEYQAMAQDSGRQMDVKTGRLTDKPGGWRYRSVFVLGQVFELAANGTNLQVTLILGLYTSPSFRNPREFVSHVWVEASGEKKPLGAAYYGYSPGYPSHIENHQSVSLVEVEQLRREKTKSGDEEFWIIKVRCAVTLQEPVDFIPDLYIDATFGLIRSLEYEVRGCRLQTPMPELRRQLDLGRTVTVTATNRAVVAAAPVRPARSQTSAENPSGMIAPGVLLAIERQGDLLLITFSPAVAGAQLEQASPDIYPWVWQPAAIASKSGTNGWYVVPRPESHIYRVRLDH